MGDFKVINTQEEFNEAIKERLQRERDLFEKKYSDYEDQKTKKEEYEKQLTELNKTLSEITEKSKGYDATVAELNSKIKAYETDSVKTRIALEHGLPLEVARRLSGEDEDSIKQDAETLSKFFTTKRTTVLPARENEPVVDDTKTALKNMLENLKEK